VSLFKDLTRTFAVAGKEALIIMRRPSALATLVVGPVLILAIFGVSFVGQPAIRAILVIPQGSGLPSDPGAYDLGQPGVLDVVGVEPTPDAAHRDLEAGRADIVVSAPKDAASQLRAGKQVTLLVEYDTVNPYQDAVIGRLAQPLAAKLNEKLVAQAIEGTAAASAAPSGDAQVLAAPTTAQTRDLAPTQPRLVSFYGVAVLALILQHLGLTLGALSMTGDRRQGMLALLRVSPVGAFEMVLGKYLAFIVLVGIVAAALLLLMTTVLAVPMLASLGSVALMMALLVIAAIGLGLVLSLLTTSESQVIQLALLVLIASVFFGGLAIDLSQFVRPLQVFAEFLPVTQATRLGQDLFLRGGPGEAWRYGALGAMAAVLVIAAWLLLRRELERRN
jgi:ABC-2 type transport system permease protein